MLNLKNSREVHVPLTPITAGEPPYTPSADAEEQARGVAPCDGYVRAVATIAVIGAFSGSTNLHQTMEVQTGNAVGTGTTQAINAPILASEVGGSDIPAVGTRRVGTSNGLLVRKGWILRVFYQETGTFGSSTRANFNTELIIQSTDHIDGSK